MGELWSVRVETKLASDEIADAAALAPLVALRHTHDAAKKIAKALKVKGYGALPPEELALGICGALQPLGLTPARRALGEKVLHKQHGWLKPVLLRLTFPEAELEPEPRATYLRLAVKAIHPDAPRIKAGYDDERAFVVRVLADGSRENAVLAHYGDTLSSLKLDVKFEHVKDVSLGKQEGKAGEFQFELQSLVAYPLAEHLVAGKGYASWAFTRRE